MRSGGSERPVGRWLRLLKRFTLKPKQAAVTSSEHYVVVKEVVYSAACTGFVFKRPGGTYGYSLVDYEECLDSLESAGDAVTNVSSLLNGSPGSVFDSAENAERHALEDFSRRYSSCES